MDCLDADTLARLFALGPHALRASAERHGVEEHLDGCQDCRELVAAFARASDGVAVGRGAGDLEADEADEASGDTDLHPDSKVSPYARTVSEGAAAGPGHEAVEGQVVGGRYVLERRLGEGGMAVVWAAHDPERGVDVALKILKESTRELTARSLREARAASRVVHPSLIEILDVVAPTRDGETPILVMPLLDGEPLDRLLSRRGRLAESDAVAIVAPVVAGMCTAHAHGIIHRDLKPPNIFLARSPRPLAAHTPVRAADSTEGAAPDHDRAPAASFDEEVTVVVLDFGLAKILGDGSDEGADKLTRTGALLGTPHYMAPEQLFGETKIDGAADVWAIGVILFECLTARRPIEGRSYGQIARNLAKEAIPALPDLVPAISPALASLVARMLTKDREARPDLFEVHVALQALRNDGPADR